MPFDETSPAMRRLLARVDTAGIRETEIPEPLREALRGGWVRRGSGAYVLAAFARTPGGPYQDLVHEESTVNGRGMDDLDLPAVGPVREAAVLRRCIAYARAALAGRPAGAATAYVSLTLAGCDGPAPTGYVTLCGRYEGVRPYIRSVADLDDGSVAAGALERRPARGAMAGTHGPR
ncbi:hypothetical protein OG756_26925 [Streptomyces sp. NBC_01310]|uniref:hypothetical protein n=1 Tax=Streptomyces sp. NBC_01310 TaxID=2903820 RepID=UPI0035B65BA5|nr:hypothetical protein OG756_26925 [Streptomyces sp. NBC_01310]